MHSFRFYIFRIQHLELKKKIFIGKFLVISIDFAEKL